MSGSSSTTRRVALISSGLPRGVPCKLSATEEFARGVERAVLHTWGRRGIQRPPRAAHRCDCGVFAWGGPVAVYTSCAPNLVGRGPHRGRRARAPSYRYPWERLLAQRLAYRIPGELGVPRPRRRRRRPDGTALQSGLLEGSSVERPFNPSFLSESKARRQAPLARSCSRRTDRSSQPDRCTPTHRWRNTARTSKRRLRVDKTRSSTRPEGRT